MMHFAVVARSHGIFLPECLDKMALGGIIHCVGDLSDRIIRTAQHTGSSFQTDIADIGMNGMPRFFFEQSGQIRSVQTGMVCKHIESDLLMKMTVNKIDTFSYMCRFCCCMVMLPHAAGKIQCHLVVQPLKLRDTVRLIGLADIQIAQGKCIFLRVSGTDTIAGNDRSIDNKMVSFVVDRILGESALAGNLIACGRFGCIFDLIIPDEIHIALYNCLIKGLFVVIRLVKKIVLPLEIQIVVDIWFVHNAVIPFSHIKMHTFTYVYID